MANAGRGVDADELILLSLAGGPKHGYALMMDIAEFSGKKVGPGTLYVAIERLEQRGLVAPIASPDRRRPYRITPDGLDALRTRVGELRRITSVATRRLALR